MDRMTALAAALCDHCLLNVGLRPMQRVINGESRVFCCYGCSIAYLVKSGSREEWDAAWLLVRLGVGAFLSMNIMLFSLLLYAGAFTGVDARLLPSIDLLLALLATPAVIILGGPFVRETWSYALRGRLTASALVVLGVGAAYAYSVVAAIESSAHVYFDTATMVLMLFTLGRYLEAAGRARAVRDLEPLLAAESEFATVVEGAAEIRRPVREVKEGTLVRVRPSERIPVDGVILEGESFTDEAVITGESRQVAKGVGSPVIAGSINTDGSLLIRSCGAANATRWAQICRSVRDALGRRSPIHQVAERVVGIFVPAVLLLGAATVLYWAQRLSFDHALLAGLAVLVVACPCAVGLAAPLAISLGIGRLARCGCLVRDPASLEALARVRLLAFDKTGTLTSGRPHLVGIEVDGVRNDEVLARAAGLERHSEHGLAQCIVDAAVARGLEPVAASGVRTVPGRGIRGHVEGQVVAAGSISLMRDLGWEVPAGLSGRARVLEASGHSLVYLGWGERMRAVLAFDDTPLAQARSTIEVLRRMGLRVALLTGDLPAAAGRIAAGVGIADVEAGLSPETKWAALARRRDRKELVAMVGDGLNDGLVLAAADVGIAVGSATDLARETATVVLPREGLSLLPWVIGVARAVRTTILTNLLWAFGYNLVALALASCGLLRPVWAAAIMAGSSILVVMNSLRLERLHDPGELPTARTASAGESHGADLSPLPGT
jgi:P-type Cu2+ transporter